MIGGHMQQLTLLATTEAQQTAEMALRKSSGLSMQLNDKMQEIQAAEEEHQALQAARMEEYRQLYEKTEPMKQVLSQSSHFCKASACNLTHVTEASSCCR